MSSVQQSTQAKVVLTIAGSDCSGGAGIQADIKTAGAFGVYACSVVTAVTAQNTQKFYAGNVLTSDVVKQQLDAVLDDLPVSIIKLGMLGSLENAELVMECIDQLAIPVVIDPVLKSSSGGNFCDMDLVAFYREELFPRAALVTPNIPEAATLLATIEVESETMAEAQAQELLGYGSDAVLLKGGHREHERATDYLATSEGVQVFSCPRLASSSTHGGGCTMAMGVAAGMAQGLRVEQAVSAAKSFMQGAISNSDRLQLSRENGPIHHFYQFW